MINGRESQDHKDGRVTHLYRSPNPGHDECVTQSKVSEPEMWISRDSSPTETLVLIIINAIAPKLRTSSSHPSPPSHTMPKYYAHLMNRHQMQYTERGNG